MPDTGILPTPVEQAYYGQSQATRLDKALDATAFKRWLVVEISRTGDIFRQRANSSRQALPRTNPPGL